MEALVTGDGDGVIGVCASMQVGTELCVYDGDVTKRRSELM